MQQFPAETAHALTRNGWRLVTLSRAVRDYEGGLLAAITGDGAWLVKGAEGIRCQGTEANPICAAMEANERAWSQPEYRTAIRLAVRASELSDAA